MIEIKKNSKIIIGFSGGPDSIYLLEYLINISKELNLTLIAAHLDHQWRENSEADYIFCKKYCEKKDIKFISKKISDLELNLKYNGSKEEFARKVRQFFFEEILKNESADFIALGHTEDDQIETFFLKLIRGSNIEGLSGIKELNNKYIRPILNVSKKEILNYLEENKIVYLNDPTNSSNLYLRNRIRHNLIPILKEIDSRFKKNILKTMSVFQETNSFLKKTTSTIESEIILNNHINIKKFLNLDQIIQKNILTNLLFQNKINKSVNKNLLLEIIRFLKNKKSQEHSFANIKIKKINDSFYFSNI